ncbi:MAG: hypothetical protein EXQ67_03315 [Thermoleophilia bacterium]|nr:hypothetical protein [Thermoleophilia bacterium]PHX80597.1 MAG: hypothetical protein CK540_07070 [Thermoleophilia bacterium]
MSNPLSLRLQGDALQRLWFQAKLAGMPPRTLAQRMLEEALRMAEHPLIDFVNNGPARRARLRGTGLEVWELVNVVKGHDGDIAGVIEYTGKSLEMVEAAVAYYGVYPDEIDVLLEENQRAYDEGHAAYLVGLERLTA